MSEWWTYRLSDFLLFSPQTYYRLFELYNAAIWPAQIVALAGGVALLVLLRIPAAWSGRTTAAILAASWLWTAFSYLRRHYDSINWAAEYFLIAFVAEAALLLALAVTRTQTRPAAERGWRFRIGFGIAAFAILLQPWIGPLLPGHDWRQAEFFGLTPDSTAAATLGVLLASQQMRWTLLILPLVWCLLGGATLWVMHMPHAFMLPLIGATVLIAAAFPALRKGKHPVA
ncbi:MAG TPA: DUF6064 family protein [Ferrovibrio sp.]|uniref:DUF6064 family protein n=1 Tax=Ferrovibrio sp. TaxID=1917215 RepID=UPI002ED22BEB